MSRNNTGNPIDSKAFLDFEDNVKNLDLAVNAEQDTFQDRLGKSRLTWAGMENQFESDQSEREVQFDADQSSREQQFRTFIASSGYQFLGDYAPGIEITEYNQVIRDENGEFWRLSGQVELPYTTTGAGIPEDDALVPAGDAVIRQDLADPAQGGDLVQVTTSTGEQTLAEALDHRVIHVDTIADLLALPTSELVDGQQVQVKEYHAGSEAGGGPFSWVPARSSENDGGTVFNGWVRQYDGPAMLEFFGVRSHASESQHVPFQQALNANVALTGTPGAEYFLAENVSSDSVDLQDCTILLDSASGTCRFGNRTALLVTQLAADVLYGRREIQLASVEGVQPGDIIRIVSAKIWPYDVDRNLNCGEVSCVQSVSGTTITLNTAVSDTYMLADGVAISVYRPAPVRLERVKVKRPSAVERSGISVTNCRGDITELRTLTAENCGQAGWSISSSYMVSVNGIGVFNCYSAGTATGYGIQVNGSTGVMVYNLEGIGCRRAIDFSGSWPSHHCGVNGFTVAGLRGVGSCVGTHGTASAIEFSNGLCMNSLIGVQVRGPDCVVRGVTFVRTSTPVVLAFTNSLLIEGCTHKSGQRAELQSMSTNSAHFLSIIEREPGFVHSERERVRIKNNVIEPRIAVVLTSPDSAGSIAYLEITDNAIAIHTNSASNEVGIVLSRTPGEFRGVLERNVVSPGAGQYQPLQNCTFGTVLLKVDGYTIPDESLEVWQGGGAVSVDNNQLVAVVGNQTCTISGYISFTVSGGPASVRIAPLPEMALGDRLCAIGISSQTYQEHLLTKFEGPALYISHDKLDYQSAFPVGSYTIPINISYKLRYPYI